jgi:hypothetical protein
MGGESVLADVVPEPDNTKINTTKRRLERFNLAAGLKPNNADINAISYKTTYDYTDFERQAIGFRFG